MLKLNVCDMIVLQRDLTDRPDVIETLVPACRTKIALHAAGRCYKTAPDNALCRLEATKQKGVVKAAVLYVLCSRYYFAATPRRFARHDQALQVLTLRLPFAVTGNNTIRVLLRANRVHGDSRSAGMESSEQVHIPFSTLRTSC